jgi:hypothetical protein
MAKLGEATIMALTEAEVESMQAFGPDTDLILRWHSVLVDKVDVMVDGEIRHARQEAAVTAQLAILLPLRQTLERVATIPSPKAIHTVIAIMERAINELDPDVLGLAGVTKPSNMKAH